MKYSCLFQLYDRYYEVLANIYIYQDIKDVNISRNKYRGRDLTALAQ